ncbi:rap1 GTPase-activating protein 1-like [Teleopsis dalmanni]|uniref:rap1 GTPase-activating protein 1-like n=1 Tax=Teleopsis dalmanni TaxID=139649 RepID=UPI0018CEA62D|nr:rap1 GTPase-activating protein 1-like [Teleopsis dalmanni]
MIVQHFKYALEGHDFVIFTDHKSLTFAFRQISKKASPRRARQLEFISQYCTDIRHLAGAVNTVADSLSRVAAVRLEANEIDLIAEGQKTDAELLAQLQNQSEDGVGLKKLRLPDSGIELYCDVSGSRVRPFVPANCRQLVLTKLHALAHPGVFIKSELKVGVIYVKEDQYSEEQILENNENSIHFDEFLTLFGDRVRLRGFDKYKGGLDTVHDLTGLYSVYTNWRNIEIMFHVSTLLPYEKHDPQKLQRKRHIGNDIVCVVFLEADNTKFSPACIKSHFLHTFILVRVSARIKHKPTRYEVSVVTRDEVGAYKPYLWEQSVFEKGPMFREWLLTKIVNGERASYSAPKFARMQERTRSQMLEDLVMNLSNHAETGQIPKPYRRGSWRPIGEDEYIKMLHARVLRKVSDTQQTSPMDVVVDGKPYASFPHKLE